MVTVRLEVVLEGEYEDLAERLDGLVVYGLQRLNIFPSSVLIEDVEEDAEEDAEEIEWL